MTTPNSKDTEALASLRKAQLAAEAAQLQKIREASRLIDLGRAISETIKTLETACAKQRGNEE